MKPLSDRLEEEAGDSQIVEHNEAWTITLAKHTEETRALLLEAAALAKSVESAPLVTVEKVGPTMAYVYFEDPPGPLKRECALVRLLQQSET